ncbi:TPR-like protein [Suillus weaverae]|nr:TPR-like protein [Suillus weaverae]
MPGSLDGQSIRLELIRVNHLPVPSGREPAGIYVSIDIDSKRRWKSPVRVPSSDDSDMLGDTAFTRELSFPPVWGYHPSLTLKVAVLHPCDDHDGALFESLVDCEIARDTDAGHARFVEYITSKTVSYLNDAVEHFQSVLDQCPVDHPDRASALANLASAHLKGYIQEDLENIDSTISLFREALALRPQGHPDHPLSLYYLAEALTWRHRKEGTAVDLHECAQLYCKLLPLCPDGTSLLRSAAGANGVDYVIQACINLPKDGSDDGTHFGQIMLQLCPLGHQRCPRTLDKLSSALRSRFTQYGSIDDLDECIKLRREVVSLCSEGHSERDTYLNNLAASLRSRFDHQRRPHDLDEAICLYEEALRMRPVGHKTRYLPLNTLGGALRVRFIERGDADDINRAISLRREALMLCPPEHPDHDRMLNNLAIALKIRYNKLDVSEDLDEAIDLYRESLRLKRLDDPECHRNLYNLSSTLSSRFTKTQKNEDVEEAIQLCQESLGTLPSLHPDRYYGHSWLNEAYLSRYQAQHNPADLSLAVDHFRLASGHPTQGFPLRIQVALNWAHQAEVYQHDSALEAYQTCLELFEKHVMTRSSIISRREAATAFGDAQSLPVDAASCAIRRNNLPQAVELAEQGRGQQWSLASRLRTPLEDLGSTSPELARKLSELSKSLSDAQGSATLTDRAAADAAARKYRRLMEKWGAASVLDQCPVDHPDRASALANLASARLKGYIRKDLQDIDSTISLFREALALRPQGHPDHPLSLYHLTDALTWRYRKERTTVDLHECAQLYCKLLPLCPEGTFLRRSAAGANGVDYVIAECINLPEDGSDDGIHLLRIVLQLCPLGHQYRPQVLCELSRALRIRFRQRGGIDDIDESIQVAREAVSLCPEGHINHHSYLNRLATSLRSRFDHQRRSHDLDEAICLHEEALRMRPVGHKTRHISLSALGGALRVRFIERGDVDDINRAISLLREALMLSPPEHPDHVLILNSLAVALQTRYKKLKLDASEDLDEAIDLYRESLRLRRLDHPERCRNLYHLSAALSSRFTKTQKNDDIEEAIRLCQESLEALPSLHLDRYFSHVCLKTAYLSRYQVQHNPADLSLAVDHFRLVSGHPTQGFPKRTQVALNWAHKAEVYQHDSALEAYQTCLELFEKHVMTRSSIISRREAATAFGDAQSLPVDAASCAICRNNLRQAVELAEQGRGQQWSLASRLRTPLEDLESTSPELARKLSELSKSLSDAQGSATLTDRAAADIAAMQYRRLMEKWGAAVAETRNLKGFSRFLLPPSYEDLKAAACQGPVIILVASQYSCSAIVIPTSGEPHHVPFPSITLTDLKNLKDRFARTIRNASTMGPKQPRNDLMVLLRTVWDEIMLPVVKVLQQSLKLKSHSRIWLCPTAAFTSIPLHAAHPFRTNADRSKKPCLEDLYICSYTPTLSALVRSRQMMKKRVAPSFVTIGQGKPGAGKGKALLAVDSELELVQKLVPATANRNTISGDAATRAGALEALQQNTWVHLACHGKQDPKQPYNSHFVMRDEHLTLLDIMERDIPHADIDVRWSLKAGEKPSPIGCEVNSPFDDRAAMVSPQRMEVSEGNPCVWNLGVESEGK